jgi:hypothetical protein
LSFLPAGVRQTARESIGTSVTEAAKQPPAIASHLVDIAHRAFLSSMRLTYTVLVLVVAMAIAVASRWLPARAPTSVADLPGGGPDLVAEPGGGTAFER